MEFATDYFELQGLKADTYLEVCVINPFNRCANLRERWQHLTQDNSTRARQHDINLICRLCVREAEPDIVRRPSKRAEIMGVFRLTPKAPRDYVRIVAWRINV